MTIGIVSTGIYIPTDVMTAEEIAFRSKLPIEVVKNKMGISKSQFQGKMIIQLQWEYGQRRKHCKKEMWIPNLSI